MDGKGQSRDAAWRRKDEGTCGQAWLGIRESFVDRVSVLMADPLGSVYLWAAVVGVLAVGYFVYSKISSQDEYGHKRNDDHDQKSHMASVTPPRQGDYTPQQLLEHDGRDPSKAVLLSLFSAPLVPLQSRCSPLITLQSLSTTSLQVPASTGRVDPTRYLQGMTAPPL